RATTGAGSSASFGPRPPGACGSRTRSSRRAIAPCAARTGALAAGRPPTGGPFEDEGWIVDPVMIDASEGAHEGLGDLVEVAESQIALIELPVQDRPARDLADEVTEPLVRGFGDGARGRLHRVREHEDRRLLRGGLRTGVAEIVGVRRGRPRGRGRSLRLLEEVGHDARPV